MPGALAPAHPDDEAWRRILTARGRDGAGADVADIPVYGPLLTLAPAATMVVGQFGQSLDGRIATPSGESKYLNGLGGMVHLHRLRAVVDAVVVGVSTVFADDPLLSVRLVEGPSPARVVIDPRGRVAAGARIFRDDGVRRIVVTLADIPIDLPMGVEIVRLAGSDGRFAPADLVAALAGLGLRRQLIEGGADTVSRFLQAGALDRLHVSVAPVLIGGGRPGLSLPAVNLLADCLRPAMHSYRLGDDILFDCDLRGETPAFNGG